MASKRLNLNKLYKALLHLENEVFTDFKDEKKVDDKTLFLRGLQEDIVSNAMGLIIALGTNRSDIAGPSSNCRSIIEAFAFLNKLTNDEFTPQQLKRFRDAYKIIEFYNAKEFWEIDPSEETKLFVEEQQKEVGDLIDAYTKEFNCDKKTVERICKDSLFVFYGNNPKKSDWIKYSDLIKDFSKKAGAVAITLYNTLGSMVHSQFISDPDVRKFQKDLVRSLSISTLMMVHNYVFGDLKISSNNCSKQRGLYKDLEDPLYVKQFDCSRRKTDFLTEFVNLATHNKTEKRYLFFRDFMERSICLFGDMDSNGILGFREQATMKFKSAIELMAFYYLTMHSKDQEETEARIECYEISSQMSVYSERKDPDSIKRMECLRERLNKVFLSFYKESYGITKYETFETNILRNGHYFLSKEDSIRDLVFKFIETNESEKDPEWRKWMRYAYLTSLDMEHSGGYALASRDEAWKFICENALGVVSRFFMSTMDWIVSLEEDKYVAEKLSLLARGFVELVLRETLAHQMYGMMPRK